MYGPVSHVWSRAQTAIAACEPGGRIVLVGMGQDNMTLPMALASIREIDIYGSFRYCNTVRPGPVKLTSQPKAGFWGGRMRPDVHISAAAYALHTLPIGCCVRQDGHCCLPKVD